jgi:Flp pilus assembly protein TadD
LLVARGAARARDAGARWVVAGAFARPNWKAEVRVRLLRVTDGAPPSLERVAEGRAVGERDKLLDVLDQALAQVLAARTWTPGEGAVAARAQLAHRPTRDLYAFTLYGRGMDALWGIGGPVDLPAAEKALAKSALVDPKFAEARRMLGQVYLQRNEPGRAAAQLHRALDLRPGYFPALVGLARIYRTEGRRQPALDLASKALDLRPGDAEMRFLAGEMEWEGGDLDRALADLKVVVEAQPRHLGARRTLALVFAARGDTIDLADELSKVAELAPDDLDVKLDLGSAFMRLGKNEQALAAYEDVLKRQPKHVQALKFSGDLYRRVGEPERAVAAYEKVRRLSPEDPRPYFLLGATYMEMGNDNKAEQILQDAQTFHRHLGEAWTDLGAIAYRRGDLPTANWYLSRAVERSPTRPKAHFNYALVLDATKQRDRALAELRTAGELDPEDAECRYLSGVIYLRLGRLDEAREEFAEAIKRKPDHADAKHNLALLEDLLKRYEGEHSATGAQ